MSKYRYVILDPTGNLTALVTEPVAPEDEAEVTRELLKQSEQVAYLEESGDPEARAHIRMMGGEFCGNAAMAAAAWLVKDELRDGEETAVPLTISGAEGIVRCRIRRDGDEFEGTAPMPAAGQIKNVMLRGLDFTAVPVGGILHLVHAEKAESRPLGKHAAERMLRAVADHTDGLPAVGMLLWNPEKQYMLPLVYVRESGSMVWETGCGSGSAAVGAYEAQRRGGGPVTVAVGQPGGTIRVTAERTENDYYAVEITGKVRIKAIHNS